MADKIAICDVPAGHVLMLWPQVRGYVESVLARDETGRYEIGDVLSALLREEAKLWVAWNEAEDRPDAAIVTEIIQYPRLRELRIWIVGGRPGTLKSWVYQTRDTLEAYARVNGCTLMGGAMREGWIKIGGPGWKKTGVTFEKRLG